MYEQLRGKRLLVIGSDEGTSSIVRTAKELGIYTIAADGIPMSVKTPAKALADESWDIDYRETERIAEKCRAAGVDGVLAGYSEFRVLAACRIAGALGTPFYATEEQIDLTWNKRRFKDLCGQCGVRVPKDYLKDPSGKPDPEVPIRFPVIVKPVDYAGRNGITICDTAEEMETAIEFARSKSVTASVLAEDYITGQEFAALYTMANGEISFSSLKDKYIMDPNENRSGLCELSVTPSRFLERYIRTADESVRRFLKAAGIVNGVTQFQGIVNDEGFWFFEMSYRLPGGNDYVYTEKCHGINYLKMMICYALTGDMGDSLEKDSPYFPRVFAQYLVYAHGGTVRRADYSALERQDGIEDIHVWARPGHTFIEDGTTQQKALTCKLSGSTIDDIIRLVRFVQTHLVIEDEDGANMLFRPFDTERIRY